MPWHTHTSFSLIDEGVQNIITCLESFQRENGEACARLRALKASKEKMERHVLGKAFQ